MEIITFQDFIDNRFDSAVAERVFGKYYHYMMAKCFSYFFDEKVEEDVFNGIVTGVCTPCSWYSRLQIHIKGTLYKVEYIPFQSREIELYKIEKSITNG